ncbi:hypothetical protein BJX68DRAFT_268578 [Aspergillus pseudodeflectus]|uniref:F-box domain-containing protein n=1 Tax=Aspergillus pseudodeflectus TaxID=176178 RepID=A0ABR4K2D3_9EURO
MRSLPDLPNELLELILHLAYATNPPHNRFDHDQNVHLDVRGLSRLLLVSRRWHQAFIPQLYSFWSYDAACHTYRSLWKFFRTIMSNPELAAVVQIINIGNWGFGRPFYLPEEPLVLNPEDLELVSKAIRLAGIGHMEEDILAKVSTPLVRDHRPLVALLLACLPNVSTIYAHVPESDPYLHAVFLAGTKKPLFAKLESIYLLAEVPVFELDAPLFRSSSDYYPALKLDVLWPALYLPSLQSMYLYDLDTKGLSDLHAAVSLYWHNYKFKTGPAKKDVTLKISNEQVWQPLEQSSATLESLDIVHGFKTGRHNVTDNFGPLTSFSALKSIIIQAEVLLGYDDSSLLTCLPFTLEDLTLMIDTVCLPRLPKLFSQLGLPSRLLN